VEFVLNKWFRTIWGKIW